MQMIEVESSSIEAIGYDPNTQELRVKFLSGPAIYAYQDVPPTVNAELMAAKSKGQFVATRIKDAYGFIRVEPGESPPIPTQAEIDRAVSQAMADED